MTLEPEHADRQRDELADAVRRLRRAADLTGASLATRTGMSQAKVSKIENNRIRPSVVDVERILTALGVSTTGEDGARLLELARVTNSDYQGFRTALQRGLGELQRDLSAIESAASTVRFFLPCMITGLLQTPEYARQTLTHPLVNRGAEWQSALARRLERQQILYRPGKRFVFVLTEAALRGHTLPQVRPWVFRLEQAHSLVRAHNRDGADPALLRKAQEAVSELSPGQPLGVDVRVDGHMTLPFSVARSAEQAAHLLGVLSPHPEGLPAWRGYRQHFIDRYGDRLVPLVEIVDPHRRPPRAGAASCSQHPGPEHSWGPGGAARTVVAQTSSSCGDGRGARGPRGRARAGVGH